MNEVRHFPAAGRRLGTTRVGEATTSICRAVDAETSTTLGAGIEILENVRLPWTVTYDEVLFIKEGAMTVHAGGRAIACAEGDIVWLPAGTSLVYDAPERCAYFYALYPVDWASLQGVEEP